ncbi:DUF1294 domain-containing protein [Bacillus massilinigeriensis]|uniref:DUF1294 domain-containing protein n=1 Tax=Bacillus mediterraneensis TaxID=1805474 RepID=UPI001F1A846D|nr:DUF1294 domain-containing protein [Bacillus mediterraneensis]
MEPKAVLLALLLFWNMYGFFLMGRDKKLAREGRYRVSERQLWLTALFGAGIGMTAGMRVFRHKTKHTSFRVGFPVIAAIEITLLLYFLY